MKPVNWKTFVITSLICLLPILLGVALWNKLPDVMAIHFSINNQPDNFAPKGFVVFGLPIMMVLFQLICCISIDNRPHSKGADEKIALLCKWIVPCMTVILYVATLLFALGKNVDMRRVAVLVVGVMFLIIGKSLPKLGYVKNYNIPPEKARKINRLVGVEITILGILFLISLFFPPMASVYCLLLLIPYIIITLIYTIKITRK